MCTAREASASGILALYPCALRAGPRGCHLHPGASPEAMGKGKGKGDQPTVPLPGSDPASSQGPGDWSHCPALAPPTPAVSGHLFLGIPPAVTLQGRSGCRQQDGGQPGAGSLEGALLLPKAFPKLEHRLSSPCSAPPPQVFLIWEPGLCPVDSADRKHSIGSRWGLEAPSFLLPHLGMPLAGRLYRPATPHL